MFILFVKANNKDKQSYSRTQVIIRHKQASLEFVWKIYVYSNPHKAYPNMSVIKIMIKNMIRKL